MKTDKDEIPWIVFICLLCVFFTYVIVDTASTQARVLEQHQRDTSLPTKCSEYYNSGTDEWKECMGVGYK